jgi:uncharacterized protein DUF1573
VIAVAAASAAPKAVFPQARFEFGQVMSGAVVERDFIVKNNGSAPLVIQKVAMTTPLLVTRQTHEVAPGAQGTIHLKLDTASLAGNFKGTIVVFLNDPALPEAPLAFEGTVVPAIELSPMPAFFVSGLRGRGGRAAIEIVNHESQPLRIEGVEHPRDRFTTQLETLQPGQRYRLTLNLKPDGPVGKTTGAILLRTSSKKMPTLTVAANTYLYGRVRTFPDGVDFGTVRANDPDRASQTLMIYQVDGSDFRVKVSTDVPGCQLKSERGPKGDRYQVTVSLIGRALKAGPIKGSITIETNDSQFSKLTVPVSGWILEK